MSLPLLKRAMKRHKPTASPRPKSKSRESAPKIIDGSLLIRESTEVRALESLQTPAGEGPVIKVILIDEGLGNRRNMNFYGPEAVASAVKAFEGKPCHIDHPRASDEEDLPERSVRTICGYYKNLRVEKITNPETQKEVSACVGELHFDLSEAGRYGYAKAQTALHYKKEFPGSPMEYIGWSVLGDGEAEQRSMVIEGEKVKVNYVTNFVEGESCDIVTRAGRGGRALVAISEDSNGTSSQSKEAGMRIKHLKQALKTVQEAAKASENAEEKKRLSESVKALQAQIAEAEQDAEESEDEKMTSMCAKREGESDEDHKSRMNSLAKIVAGHLGETDEPDPEKDKKPEPAAAPKESADTLEAKALAIESYMAKAGLPEGSYNAEKIARLAKLPFKEAKAKIDDDALLAEKIAEGANIPVASLRGGVREGAESGGTNNSKFAESFKKERN